MEGNRESWFDLPSRTFQSAPLMLAATISITTSRDAATGSGMSPNFRTSGPPCRSMKAAFMGAPWTSPAFATLEKRLASCNGEDMHLSGVTGAAAPHQLTVVRRRLKG